MRKLFTFSIASDSDLIHAIDSIELSSDRPIEQLQSFVELTGDSLSGFYLNMTFYELFVGEIALVPTITLIDGDSNPYTVFGEEV